MICRRRRLGHNSWLHGAVHDGKAETAVWLAPGDLASLGLPRGGEILLETTGTTLQVPAVPVTDVPQGIVVVPHGLREANANALIPTGIEMIEPLSGQHRMTGIPVRITPVCRSLSMRSDDHLMCLPQQSVPIYESAKASRGVFSVQCFHCSTVQGVLIDILQRF